MKPLEWADELSSRLSQGALSFANDYTDFGGEPWGPQLRVRTETTDEALWVLDIARRHAATVAIRGSGHTSGGQTCTRSGMVLTHAPPAEELRMHGSAVEVPAHWRWSRLEAHLRSLGRDLLVATSSVETTVAGTLSLGGFGVRSVRSGPQVDQVEALRLVCATGDVKWCSPHEHADLFHSALTGLGQVGLIDRVLMQTCPRRDYLSCVIGQHATFTDLAEYLIANLSHADDAPDYCSALAKGDRIESLLATAHETVEAASRGLGSRPLIGRPQLRRELITVAQFEQEERRMPLGYWGTCRNLWCDYCFEAPAFLRFAAFVDAQLRGTLFGHLAYALSIAPRQGVPLALDMRPSATRQLFSLGLFYSVPAEDAAAVAQGLSCHQRALEACVALGGRPYLHGLWAGPHGLGAEQLRRIYGHTYQRLRSVRGRVDPAGILNPLAMGGTLQGYPPP